MRRERPEACPACGRSDLVRIVYGFPGPDLVAKAEAGEVALGGCCVTGDDPAWSCRGCGWTGPPHDLSRTSSDDGA